MSVCYLCNKPLKNGHRMLKIADFESSSAKCGGRDISRSLERSGDIGGCSESPQSTFVRLEDGCDDVKVCWSSCPATTAMLMDLAKRKLDEDDSSHTPVSVIRDAPFDLGYLTYDPLRYMEFLEAKRDRVVGELSTCGVTLPGVKTFASPPKHFRNRCRLGIHVTYSKEEDKVDKVRFLQWNAEGVPDVEVEHFPVASMLINALISSLKCLLPESSPILCRYLSSIHLLSSLQGQAVITLVYDVNSTIASRKEEWHGAASTLLASLFQTTEGLEEGGCGIVAQSKGVRFIEPEGKDYVMESLAVQTEAGQLSLRYKFPIAGFSNPNGAVNQLCLGWLSNVVNTSHKGRLEDHDLLELYCGAANHTCALARYFRKVVCVELNKALCKAAETNLALNSITNVKVVSGASEKFAFGLLRRKGYVDKSTDPPSSYRFSTVLVDPQRGGLDEVTRELLCQMPRIIYISCNPKSLVRDLSIICRGDDPARPRFRVENFAVFDHFAYSDGHLESGVYLVKNDA